MEFCFGNQEIAQVDFKFFLFGGGESFVRRPRPVNGVLFVYDPVAERSVGFQLFLIGGNFFGRQKTDVGKALPQVKTENAVFVRILADKIYVVLVFYQFTVKKR